MDTPYGVAQEQPPSSGPAYHPGCEHQSMGFHPVAHPQDQSTGKLVRLAISGQGWQSAIHLQTDSQASIWIAMSKV